MVQTIHMLEPQRKERNFQVREIGTDLLRCGTGVKTWMKIERDLESQFLKIFFIQYSLTNLDPIIRILK